MCIRDSQWTDLHEILQGGSSRRRNHLFQILCRSVEGFGICVGSNFGILPLLSRSPLTQGWRYRAACDKFWPLSVTPWPLNLLYHMLIKRKVLFSQVYLFLSWGKARDKEEDARRNVICLLYWRTAHSTIWALKCTNIHAASAAYLGCSVKPGLNVNVELISLVTTRSKVDHLKTRISSPAVYI